jgi:DNA topoisomerase-1
MSSFYKFSGGGRGGTGRGGGRGRGRFSNTKSTAPSSSKNFVPNPNATHLLIVESPSKCPKISEYLGDQFHCIASKGHIRELISLANAYSSTKTGFQTKYTLCPDKIDHVEKMRQTIARFPPQNVILATDDDREGEAIAWHICQVFHLPVETTHRIIFHSITYESILEAVKHPRTIDMNLVHAQQTRQILDVIVGFKISPFLWRHVGNPNKSQSLSAGRCQTPALRLVYDAHLVAASQKSPEIGGNLQEEIGKYKIRAYFLSMNLEFNTDTTFATGKQVQEFLESSLPDNVHHLLPIEKSKEYSQAPPAPFHTSHLLQVANQKLGLSPKLTMTLCQQLYQEGHITYMRTDSKTYSPEFQGQVQEFIQQKYGANYVSGGGGGASGFSAKSSTTKKGGVAPQEAHEAIRPTHIETMGYLSTANSGNHEDADADDAPELKGDTAAVKGKKQALYQLIWRNTIESCMPACRGQRTRVRIQGPPLCGGPEKGATENILYTHDIEVPHFPGWKRVQQWSDAEFKSLQKKQEGIVQYVSHMNPQTPLVPNRIEAEYTEPRPPYYYTESSLIEKLESMGIGRPSTFAMLVDTIQERGYVKKQDLEGRLVNYTDYLCIPNPQPPQTVIQALPKQKKFGAQKGKLVIQPLGISALDFLIPSFSRLFDYEYTSQMESQLDEIARGEKAIGVLEKDCYEEIKNLSKPLLDKEKETYSILGNEEYQVAYGKSGPVVFRLIPATSETSDKLVEEEKEEEVEKTVEKKEEEPEEEPEVPLKKTRKTKTPKPVKEKPPKIPKPPKMEKEYLPMRKNLKIDKEKLIQGQYTLEELVEWTDPILGIHEGESMILKSGKFGAYVEWGEKRESITPLVEQRKKQGLDSHDLEISDVLAFLREKEANGGAVVDGKKILRVFTPEISVRMGRFGPYVFYQSSTAPPNTKPQFLSLKKLEVGYLTCSKIQFLKWLADTHGVSG